MKKIVNAILTLSLIFGASQLAVFASEASGGGDTNTAYGYMISFTANEEGVAVKILTVDGEVKEYPCAENVKSNVEGIASHAPDLLLASGGFSKPGLVLYELDTAERLNAIYLPADYKSGRPADNQGFGLHYSDGTARFASPLLGRYGVTEDTVIFRVPYADRKNDSDYKVCKRDDLEDGVYNVLVYDVDKDYRIGALVIRDRELIKLPNDANLMVVDGLTEAGIISGYVNGEKITLKIDDGAKIYESAKWSGKNIRDMKTGDVLQYDLDANGCISIYRVLFDIEKDYGKGFFEKHSEASAPTYNSSYAELYTGYARVIGKTSYSIIINSHEDDYLWDKAFPIEKANIYEYADGGDLKTVGYDDVNPGDAVFIRAKYINNEVDIIVFKLK